MNRSRKLHIRIWSLAGWSRELHIWSWSRVKWSRFLSVWSWTPWIRLRNKVRTSKFERKRKCCNWIYGVTLWVNPNPCSSPVTPIIKMASRWLPDNKEFFESLLRLIETAEAQANSASYDASEFLFRRLDAYERTLSTPKSRVAESLGWDFSTRSDPPEVISQLSYILQRTTQHT